MGTGTALADHAAAPAVAEKERAPAPRTAVLVGNPNVGKSALFGALTGKYAVVSNYPGTTVEVTRGSARIDGASWTVLDTPGTAGLLPMSEDEQVARDMLLDQRGATVLQVCDAKNLRRGLMLLLELSEARVPLVLALNMADEARGKGIAIDVGKLEAALGVPVIPTVAVQRAGLPQLRSRLGEARPSTLAPAYGPQIEAAIAAVQAELPADLGLDARCLSLLVLLRDESLRKRLQARLPASALARLDLAAARAAAGSASLRMQVAQQRLQLVDRVLREVMTQQAPARRGPRASARLDRWTTHAVWGVPVLAAVLFACYEFVGVLGAKVAVDFLEQTVFAGWLVPLFEKLVRLATPAGAVQTLLVGPPGQVAREGGGLLVGKYGLFSMGVSYGIAIVLPIVATFFLAFSVLEDSGYLPRLSVMVDRAFRKMGLNGKAVLPMVLGLGCDTMATMTARILETKKERVLVTLLLALGVPCSAQLAVIFAMLAGVHTGAALWFVGAMLAVLFAVGWLAAKILPGRTSDFVLELPPLRLPQPGNVLIKTVARIEWYLREALPLFLIGTALLWTLDRTGALAVVERAFAPIIVGLLDLPRESAGAFIAGFLRRDYAAAGLFAHYEPLARSGALTRSMEVEIVTALVTISLFIPCIANFLVIIKERGAKAAGAMMAAILPIAFGSGALVNVLMRRFWL